MRLLHIIHSIAQICMDGIIFIMDLLCLANEAVSPTPDLLQHEHLRILYCMHLCVNTDMHDLMHTYDVYMNQKVELIVIHGTLFLIAARKSC